jgi:hypothetical protein
MGILCRRQNSFSYSNSNSRSTDSVSLPSAEPSQDIDQFLPRQDENSVTLTVRSKGRTLTVGAAGNTAFNVTPSACASNEVHIRYNGASNPDIRVRNTGYDQSTGEYTHEVSFDRNTVNALNLTVDGKAFVAPNTIRPAAAKLQIAEKAPKPALPPETVQELERLREENAGLKAENTKLNEQLAELTRKNTEMEARVTRLEKLLENASKQEKPAQSLPQPAVKAPPKVTLMPSLVPPAAAPAEPISTPGSAPNPAAVQPPKEQEPIQLPKPPVITATEPVQLPKPPVLPVPPVPPAPAEKEEPKPAVPAEQRRKLDDTILQAKVARLKAAMPDKWGTDEDAVWEALDGVTGPDMDRLKELYKATVGTPLVDHISSEMDGTYYAYSMALASGDRATQIAGKIYYAMEWNVFPFGNTDEDMIAGALDTAKSEGIAFSQIAGAYNSQKCGNKTLQEWYGKSFVDSLHAELSDSDYATYVTKHIDTSK